MGGCGRMLEGTSTGPFCERMLEGVRKFCHKVQVPGTCTYCSRY